jgi:outer membrane receptor for ferric coprogen and ferric-rhodotorulic acid
VVNFQYDGVGMPQVFGNVQGDIDTALYERIDIVRGANGLMASTGNPSATVNFIRKRPTATTTASASRHPRLVEQPPRRGRRQHPAE